MTLSLLTGNQELQLSVCSVGSANGTDSLALISLFVRNLRVSLSIESVSHSNLEASVPLAAYDTHYLLLLHVTSTRLGSFKEAFYSFFISILKYLQIISKTVFSTSYRTYFIFISFSKFSLLMLSSRDDRLMDE